MKLLLFLLAAVFPMLVFSQDSTIVPPKVEFPTRVPIAEMWECCCSNDAGYPGGIKEFHKYIQRELNLSGIPGFSAENGSRIYVTFVVSEFGAIQNVEVAKNKNKEVIKEIERVFYAMPEWVPSEFQGKIVPTRVRIPIKVVWTEQFTCCIF